MFLEKIDFAKMYYEHTKVTNFKGKNSKDWDKKSKDMVASAENSPYVNDFISQLIFVFWMVLGSIIAVAMGKIMILAISIEMLLVILVVILTISTMKLYIKAKQ